MIIKVIMDTHCFSLLSVHNLFWQQHPDFHLGNTSASVGPFVVGRADPTL